MNRSNPETTRAALGRLSPFTRRSFDAATALANRLHAEEVTLPHWLVALMHDEESAAHQIAVHAFADPETLELELLALAPGLMVVGSDGAVPFSPSAVAALRAARSRAADAGAESVEPAIVLEAACAHLAPAAREALRAAGLSEANLAGPPPAGSSTRVAPDGPLFKHFAELSKVALSRACKAARSARESQITPARLVMGLLAADPALEARCGLTRSRFQVALAAHLADLAPPLTGELPADGELLSFLGALPPAAGSLDVLAQALREGAEELRALLARHKLGAALLERARGKFEDPSS